MAPKPGRPPLLLLLLLWWTLLLVAPGAVSSCDISCSTDYDVSLNCSCGGSSPTHPVLIRVSCSNEEDEVNGSCEVVPPSSWCIILPEGFEDVTSVETACNATAVASGGAAPQPAASASWLLGDVVKPPPPFNVLVASAEESVHISWNHSNWQDCLTYRLRVGAGGEELMDIEVMEVKRFTLSQKTLRPSVRYAVSVQAKMCPGNLYKGPWSEWSPAAEWRTAGGSHKWQLFYLPPSLVLVIVALIFLVLKMWGNKIPDPNEFFKPLYNNYGGNFKDWVKPVFSEYDLLRIGSQPPASSEKQLEVEEWTGEKQSSRAGVGAGACGGHLLGALQPGDNSLLFFLEGGRSDGAGQSAGHVSIHTVTLSGERELLEEGEALLENRPGALRGLHSDPENLGLVEQPAFLFQEPLARLGRHSGVSENLGPPSRHSSEEDLDFQEPHEDLAEAERVSMDSFVFNERSDDGYPHVDLDTIDSGFGECGSPGSTESNGSESSDSLQPFKSSHHSNYVKQWVACSTAEDG